MTTPTLSPHERIPSISVLAAMNEGFELEREREKEIATTQMLLHKGSIYRTTCVGFKLKSPLKCMWPISYNMPNSLKRVVPYHISYST